MRQMFISTYEKCKNTKKKLDSTLEILYDYVLEDCNSKRSNSLLNRSHMLQLNELLNLVDRFLSEFQINLARQPVNDTHVNAQEEDINICVGGNVVDCDGSKEFCESNSAEKSVDSKTERESFETNCVEKAVNNHRKGNDIEKQYNGVDAIKKETHQQTSDYDIDDNSSISSSEVTSVCSASGDISSVSKDDTFLIEKQAQMKLNGTYKVSVQHVNNLNDFYVNIMNNVTREFFTSWNGMVKFYKEHRKDKKYLWNFQAKDCDIYVAVLYNTLWYRAKLLSKHNSYMVRLYLIDVGKCIKARGLNCRILKRCFDFPIVLQNVHLNLEFSPQRQTLFNALVGSADDKILFQVKCVGIVEGKYYVIMHNYQNVKVVINDIISAMSTNEGIQDSNEQAMAESTSGGLLEHLLDNFDPMKEAFFSETNDYRINPDNPCQAVMGYIPNDDRRYCKFGKRCRKKACPRLHQEQDPNGWTRDEEESTMKAYITPELPLHELIEVTVSHVVDIGEFYGQIESSEDNEDEETLTSLMEYMNRSERKMKMKKLPTQPAPGEMVIACYKGVLYRGKVVLFNPETDLCTVFFVDLGCRQGIHLKDLRQMSGEYNHLPFQARHFSIRHALAVTVPKCSEGYEPLLHLFRRLVLYKTLNCVVQSYTREPCDIVLLTCAEKPSDIGEYFSSCCLRVLRDAKSDSESTSVSTQDGNYSTSHFKLNDVTFLPG